MNADDRERQLEHWLDDALRGYSDVEPRAGLEQRVLANLETRQCERRPWWQWALVPAAVAIAISAAVLLIERTRPLPPASPVARVAPRVSAPAKGVPAVRQVVHPASPPAGVHRSAPPPMQVALAQRDRPPRLNAFPSPAPLSPQEIAVLRLVRHDPHEAALLAQAQEAERMRFWEKFLQDTGAPTLWK
jgi:hypothetical protein